MRLLFLIGLLAAFFVVHPSHAQPLIWNKTGAPYRGPEAAAGVLIHFPDRLDDPVSKNVLPDLSWTLAVEAQWDVLHIVRDPSVDSTLDDDRVLAFAAEHIDRARRDGYKRIVVSGLGRGGWLALLAATLDNVDGALAFAPGTVGLSRERLEWQRDELVERLSRTKARRIAIFFFRDDPLEGVDRADPVRQALRRKGSAFMLIDRAPNEKDFAHRYTNCVLRLLQDVRAAPGERSCNLSQRAL